MLIWVPVSLGQEVLNVAAPAPALPSHWEVGIAGRLTTPGPDWAKAPWVNARSNTLPTEVRRSPIFVYSNENLVIFDMVSIIALRILIYIHAIILHSLNLMSRPGHLLDWITPRQNPKPRQTNFGNHRESYTKEGTGSNSAPISTKT